MLIVPNFAHEVYVLRPNQITTDEKLKNVNVLDALKSSHNLRLFLLILVGSGLVFTLLLFLKSTNFFKKTGRFIDRATVIAPDIIRIAFGLSLLLSAKHNVVFGPELPLSGFPHNGLIRILLVVFGSALVFGIFTRLFALLALLLYFYTFAVRGWYILTYLNYLGEAIAVALLPVQTISIDALIRKIRKLKIPRYKYEKYSMPATRIFFGLALLYTAINIKFATVSLSLDVVREYDLTRYFPFDPLFVVLGSGLVECAIALLYITGLLRRVNSIIFLGFIISSLLFFKEAVWPHYLLIALAVGIFLHKADDLSLDKKLFSKKHQLGR